MSTNTCLPVTVWAVQYTDTKELYAVFATLEGAFAHLARGYNIPGVEHNRVMTDYYNVEIRSNATDKEPLERFMVYRTTVLS